MGLRGPKRSKVLAARDRRIWRAYLRLKVLGYYATGDMYRRVADELQESCDIVRGVVCATQARGCYDEPTN